uniref:Podocalyxin n=1 Tax=Xenopus tropicalis TaxID=8364 RepID=A0A803K1W2_XENTR
MTKLNLLLALWAVGCGMLSMAQSTTVTVATMPLKTITTTMDTATTLITKPVTTAISTTSVKSLSTSVTSSTANSVASASTTNITNPPTTSLPTSSTPNKTTEGKMDSTITTSVTPSPQPSLKPTATSSTVNPVSFQSKAETPQTIGTTVKQELSSPAEPTSTSAQLSRTTQDQDTKPTNTSTVHSSFNSPTSLTTTNTISKMTSKVTTSKDTAESYTTSMPLGSTTVSPAVNTTLLTTFQTSTKFPGNCTENVKDDIHKHQCDLLHKMCKAVRPEFQPSEKCKISLGFNEKRSDRVEVLNVVVETRLAPNRLNEVLEKLTDEGGKSLFVIDTTEAIYEDWLSMPLIITIVCLAVSLLLIAAVYGCWHQRQSHKREQRLTEELQTMENGYHDNPTLEVMETAPEMQEKKGGLNGELGDSWIVPLDNLREELEEEEDTHL